MHQRWIAQVYFQRYVHGQKELSSLQDDNCTEIARLSEHG